MGLCCSQRIGSLPGKVNLSSFLGKGVSSIMPAAKVHLRRKSERTSMPYFCEGGKMLTSLALAARESGLSGNRPCDANTPGGLQFPYPSKDRRRKGTIKLKSESGYRQVCSMSGAAASPPA